MTIEKLLTASVQESAQTKLHFWESQKDLFFKAAKILIEAVKTGNKVLIFGNGGSACDAMHFAGEWVNRFNLNRAPLPALALTADAPLMSCIGNDFGFDFVFEKQILALARPGDVVIGLSTSGNSKNVICALEAAKKIGARTLVLSGGNGGIIKTRSADWDVLLMADYSKSTPRIQECHEWILHSLSEAVELELFGKNT
jgi:D-sedoheptulose 7-phosphate isomerase